MRGTDIFLAAIKERYCLNPGSEKQTYHLVLDLSGSGISYAAGDCVGVYPPNCPTEVDRLLTTLNASGTESVTDREGNSLPLRQFLSEKANLSKVPETKDVTLQQFCDQIRPMLPRFYSIASSQEHVGDEVHLTVACTGLCSDFLCNRAPLDYAVLPLFHHPANKFSLPAESNDKPIIMIGPGTGVAPFRGFLQERIARSASSKNWLFFGERNRSCDFYYESEWKRFTGENKLILDTAFSRDQAHKVYVQDKMLEKGAEIWNWLQQGAYIYVCGDAKQMAKAVDRALKQIIETIGGHDPKPYLKELRATSRYQRDVY